MRSHQGQAVDQLTAALDTLAATDTAELADHTLREQLLDLANLSNRVHAELTRRVDVFDRRGLAEPDGFRTTKTWLQAFAQLSGSAAARIVSAARLLRRLPKLAAVAQAGHASAEQVQQVVRLATQVGVEPVAEAEATLAEAAGMLDPGRFATVCARVQAHLDPDGGDPAADFDRRALTLAPAGGMLILRGQLDAAGGAALSTTLDALMIPPADGDERSPAQRRADALVELAGRQLSAGTLPTVAGQRPQVGVLLHPQALSPDLLARLAEAHRGQSTRQRLQALITDPGATASDWTRPGVTLDRHEQVPTGLGHTSSQLHKGLTGPAAPTEQTPDRDTVGGAAGRPPPVAPAEPEPATHTPGWDRPGWADPPWLSWHGPISPVVAQRVACDADIWRVILNPDTGQPLDVGRRHRLVPPWLRRALHTRDRGCRWPGCPTPAEWTDAHHIVSWADNGPTSVDNCLLLCRHHHGLVHDGGWTLTRDPATGQITITRPTGRPYDIVGTWNGPSARAA